jgi:rubrerythrin
METISRRQFLFFVSTSLVLASPYSLGFASTRQKNLKKENRFLITIDVLRTAYLLEMMAYNHYNGYCRKAIEEKYPNIAYLFTAFAVSEKTHADNYKRVLSSLSVVVNEPELEISISDTKANLRNAADKELIKITKTYPDLLSKLETESHDQAVINCMYSWKSHGQHEKKIKEIQKYSGIFFGSVAKSIEGMKLDFYVCEICGSTIDQAPKTACIICNYPISHYQEIIRPA